MQGQSKAIASSPASPATPPASPRGTRHKATQAVEALLEGEDETLTRKAIELAKNGDMAALRLCVPSGEKQGWEILRSANRRLPQVVNQSLRSSGTLPPFSASFRMTCLCSHMFMDAESFISPEYFNSRASSFRADRLLSRSRSFRRSTIDLRQSSFSFRFDARSVRIATTSTCTGDPVELALFPDAGA